MQWHCWSNRWYITRAFDPLCILLFIYLRIDPAIPGLFSLPSHSPIADSSDNDGVFWAVVSFGEPRTNLISRAHLHWKSGGYGIPPSKEGLAGNLEPRHKTRNAQSNQNDWNDSLSCWEVPYWWARDIIFWTSEVTYSSKVLHILWSQTLTNQNVMQINSFP